jgi:sarcosine oxidase subunit alpha
MSQAFRLQTAGRVRRDRSLKFSFDGKRYEGYEGDTLASALIANGVHLVGRSFKYHRPRGIVTTGSDEPNALVGLGGDPARYSPNVRATQIELYDGLVAESQNRWPSLAFDAGAANELIASFLPAGFYYKTFMWPKAAWGKLYEPFIRRAAGLGRAPTKPDADRYTQVYAHCDVLVVGAGPAGLSAALAAAETGSKVVLCDEQSEMGGSLLSEGAARIDGKSSSDWVAAMLEDLRSRANVTLMPRTTAFGWYPHNLVGLCERVTDHHGAKAQALPRERLWQMRARDVILATGALERPLVFPENDRPGVMMSEAARTFVNRYAAKPGHRAVVFTACDSAYRAAIDLKRAGVDVAVIADLRANPAAHWLETARSNGIDVRTNTSVNATGGRLRVSWVDLITVNAKGQAGSKERVPCDLVLMSGGWTPNVSLFSQSRGKLLYDETLQSFVPGDAEERVHSVGACRGIYELSEVLDDGSAIVARFQPCTGSAASTRKRSYAVEADSVGLDGFIGAVPHGRNPLKTRAWVDFQNDVTSKDVRLATREGFQSIEHVKRYTTTGMATDQGKSSNMNALGIVSRELNRPVPKVGLTTFRPPYTPTTFGVFAGQSRGLLFDPVRRTAIHHWAEEKGAVFEDVGLWKRAFYFPQKGEDMHAAVARECLATRNSVGIFDASTLGKIEVVGKDAAEFMNRMYTNPWAKLEPGRARYGLLLREDGFIYDDGVVGRMTADQFHVTTTTGGAARVLAMMEDYLQTEWPDLDVWLTSTTEQWAVIAVQGPLARKVLEPLVSGIDISREAMPHMSVREGQICGVPTRLFRVSFTGELGFEVNVPAGYGLAVWEAVLAAGAPYGITPYGTETMHVLRAEKGYIVVGQETDGTVTPDDAGLTWAIGKAKKDFVGKRSLARPAIAAQGRKQLIGLITADPKIVLEEGAQVTLSADATQSLGHVTSSYWSSVLNRSIALALVQDGRNRKGARLTVPMVGGSIEVEVTEPIFYDKKGERLDG